MRLTTHICRWIRRYQRPGPPGAMVDAGAEAPLEPTSDGGWQNRDYPSNAHRAREYAEHVDFPSSVRPSRPDDEGHGQ